MPRLFELHYVSSQNLTKWLEYDLTAGCRNDCVGEGTDRWYACWIFELFLETQNKVCLL